MKSTTWTVTLHVTGTVTIEVDAFEEITADMAKAAAEKWVSSNEDVLSGIECEETDRTLYVVSGHPDNQVT